MPQAEFDIKANWNQEAPLSAEIGLDSGGRLSASNTYFKDTLNDHESDKYSKSIPKDEGSLLVNNELDGSEFSLVHSQASALTHIFGSRSGETEISYKKTIFEQMKEIFSLCSLDRNTYSFHAKDVKSLRDDVIPERLNDTSKGSEVIEPTKTTTADSEVHRQKPEKYYGRRIIIEGTSEGTNKREALRQFSKYGFIKSLTIVGAAIHIEYFEWQSVERIFAENAQEKITVDGKEIQIKTNMRKSKKGLQIGMLPKKIRTLFSSEEKFLNQLDGILSCFHLDPLDIHKHEIACKSIVSSLKDFVPRVYPYGSRITGLASKKSDLDIFVYITKPSKYIETKYLRPTQEHIIHDAAQHIMCNSDFSNVVKIPKAYVPLLSCQHMPTGLKCDLTFRYPYQVYNTGLTITYLSMDCRVRQLILLIRYWASALALVGKGKFSSYSLNLMCIFYLQQIPDKPVLPSVSLLMKLAREHERASHGCWDCGYCEDISLIPKLANNMSLFHLVKGFFKFFSEFDMNSWVVCPYLGKPVKKYFFRPGMEYLLPVEFEKYKSNCLENLSEPLKVDHVLCIQDPFVHNCNVAKQNCQDIVELFRTYCHMCAHEHDYEEKLASPKIINAVSQGKLNGNFQN